MSISKIPIDVAHMFPLLDSMLIDLLKSLSEDEWQKPTIAKLWTVKDVAGHLLDSDVRALSMLRDNYYGEKTNANSFEEMVSFLNGLNADWVKAMRRVSPGLLITLHEITGPIRSEYYKNVDPLGKSGFAVDWAGENESLNWMHIAREYTEKWLHQQQIRNAVNKPALMTRELYLPFIETFMRALPHTYRNVSADDNTVIQVTVSSDIGGTWFLLRLNDKWELHKEKPGVPATIITIDPDTAWKLFSKSFRAHQVRDHVTITGDEKLGEMVLEMVSVMA